MTTDTGHAGQATTSHEEIAARTAAGPERIALVVGHDGQRASAAALRKAIDLALRLGAHLHVIHSVTVHDYGVDPDSDSFEVECERNLARERETTAATLAGTSVPWTYHEERGDPARQLARLADEVNASFIIVGATEGGVVHHLVGGDSVPKRLLHSQTRPVLVVPPDRPAE